MFGLRAAEGSLEPLCSFDVTVSQPAPKQDRLSLHRVVRFFLMGASGVPHQDSQCSSYPGRLSRLGDDAYPARDSFFQRSGVRRRRRGCPRLDVYARRFIRLGMSNRERIHPRNRCRRTSAAGISAPRLVKGCLCPLGACRNRPRTAHPRLGVRTRIRNLRPCRYRGLERNGDWPG